MADADISESAENDGRRDCQSLLLSLKKTVEGLLATHSNNVWTTYGGLSRLCSCVEAILTHRLKVYHYTGDLGCVPDYWPLIQGLKWLQPTSAPYIDRLSRMTQSTDSLMKGPLWLRDSLQAHTLSSQLKTLVHHSNHLEQFYQDDAFLCNIEFFQAMLLCLQAVELNKVSILTEININLITCHRKLGHTRSASLPINHLSDMGRRKSSSHDVSALAPSFSSPKSESILAPSEERALPTSTDSLKTSSLSTAKDALISVLEKSGGGSSPPVSNSPLLETSLSLLDRVNSEPLMNLEVFTSNPRKITSRKYKSRNLSEGNINSYRHSRRSSGSKSRIKRKSDSECLHEYRDVNIVSAESSLDDILNCDNDTFQEEITVLKGSDKEPSTEAVVSSVPFNKPSHRRVKSDILVHSSKPSDNINNSHGNNPTDQSEHENRSNFSSSLPKTQRPLMETQENQESGHSEYLCESYFPKPSQGQSLMSYLSSQDFHTCANIDKENAHFSISEALIAAIEQMKWNSVIRPPSDIDEESDEEIQELKQRIRLRRRERLHEKTKGYQLLSDGMTDTNTTSSCSPPPLSFDSTLHSDGSVTDDNDDGDVDDGQIELSFGDSQASNLTTLKDSGLSLSMASLYSDADIVKNPIPTQTFEQQSSMVESTGSFVSAESVAISLLKKFSEKHLPKACELDWLVSEQDAPQALLPLPDSMPISPDDGENSDLLRMTKRPRIRGNLEWAPPRAQIIFNIHPVRKRNVVLSKQNDRCAGCGMRVEPGYVKRFRFCEYLGKYFCQCCHTNSLCYIPGRILQKWDFTRYGVSNFAKDLLTKLFDNPLFNVDDINPGLYRKVAALSTVSDLRTQLYHLHNILTICKHAASVFNDLERLPVHWLDNSHLFSMADLLKLKSGELQHILRDYYQRSTAHITQCQFCLGMGFICEFCNNDQDIIFPYQLQKAIQCHGCKACYHKSCFQPEKCPKCARLEARRQRLLTVTPSPDQEQPPSQFMDDSQTIN